MRAHRVIAGLALIPFGCASPPTADLSTTGTIAGTVTSSTGGPLANIALVAVPELGGNAAAPLATLSQSSGQYSIPNVPIGPGSVLTTGSLPTGCSSSGASYSMPIGATSITVNVTVPCGITTGTIYGLVTSLSGAALAGVSVIITPAGGKPLGAVTTGANGSYSNDSVPTSPANGTVSLANLPTGCTTPAPLAYSGLTPVGSVTVNIAVGCQETATTTDGLWIDGQYLLSTAQLAQSGAVTPADSCGGVPAGNQFGAGVGPEAFDASGNLWTQRFVSAGGNLTAWTPAQLSATCSSGTPGITVPFTGGAITALAFDPRGTLWVAAPTNTSGMLYGFLAAQLAATSSNTVTPAYTITMSDFPYSLAFDASGNLWVGNAASMVEYSAAQLNAATTGSAHTTPTPTRSITKALGVSAAALAFDARGDLWVTVDAAYDSLSQTDSSYFTVNADSIVEYAASQLASLSNSTTPATAIGEATGDGANGIQWGATAFDANGNLWLGTSIGGANGIVYRFPTANLAPGGGGVPDLIIQSSNGLIGDTFSLAFNPIPAGLPIYGQRANRLTHVTPTKSRAPRAKPVYR